jgi:hypothetical protein
LSSALLENSGVLMAGAASTLLRVILAGFLAPAIAKVAWNFKLQTESSKCMVLSTETRIRCFGLAALWKFRFYWSLVGPFSGLIRKAILKQVKIEAESIVIETS